MTKILIVDDYEAIREALTLELLERFNVCVIEADSGLAAAEVIQTQAPHLVISDLEMSNGDGLWLQRFMLQSNCQIPLIFFSSSANIRQIPCTPPLMGSVLKFDINELCRVILQVPGFELKRNAKVP